MLLGRWWTWVCRRSGFRSGWLPWLRTRGGGGARDRSGIECTRVRFELPEEKGHRHLKDVLGSWMRGAGGSGRGGGGPGVSPDRGGGGRDPRGGCGAGPFPRGGALDSILDVLCCMAGIVELGYRNASRGRWRWGAARWKWTTVDTRSRRRPRPGCWKGCGSGRRGTRRSAPPHGRGAPCRADGGTVTAVGDPVRRIGYGAGSRDPAGRPTA
jgi:hypothetical protein